MNIWLLLNLFQRDMKSTLIKIIVKGEGGKVMNIHIVLDLKMDALQEIMKWRDQSNAKKVTKELEISFSQLSLKKKK